MENTERARLHAALGDANRLAIVDMLYLSERSPADIARRLGIESNLLSHHLDVLAGVGLVRRLRSSGDRRRRYVRLDLERLDEAFSPSRPIPAASVLFVCTHNSARSQMAAALWQAESPVRAESAGTAPADSVHPMAVQTAARHGLDLTDARPRSLGEVTSTPDLVVTVCDEAHEQIGDRPTRRLHWSVPDPARAGIPEAFEEAFGALRRRVSALAANVDEASSPQ